MKHINTSTGQVCLLTWPTEIKKQKTIARLVAQHAVPRGGRSDSNRYHECFEVCGFSLVAKGSTKAELAAHVVTLLQNGRPTIE